MSTPSLHGKAALRGLSFAREKPRENPVKITLEDVPSQLPRLALSYGLEALIVSAAGQSEGQLTAQTLALCALRLYPEKVVKEHLDDLSARFAQRVERLATAADSRPQGTSPGPGGSPGRTLGSSLREWTHTLDQSAICLYLAGFDPERAHYLYWWVEADLLEVALEAKLGFESAQHINRYEAALYGFGGKYSSDEGQQEAGPVEEHDLTTEAGQQALGAMMGFKF